MTSRQLANLSIIASKQAPELAIEFDDRLVNQSVTYLSSPEALESLQIDPYWPKWDSPWWHMLLLHEMGLTSIIPTSIIEALIDALNGHYLKFFPLTQTEIPAGIDLTHQVACHCQLGTIHQLLKSYGIDVDVRVSWLRPWYLNYQLSDGGLNCDEAAYTRSDPKSSVVSTVPPLEVLLNHAEQNLTPAEIGFLDRGAKYLIEKRLCRTSSTGRLIDENWLQLCFPRFYHYDVLRGLSFILGWSRRFKRHLPISAIRESIEYIDDRFADGSIRVQRAAWAGANTRCFDRSRKSWTKAPAACFPLLKSVSEVGTVSVFLTELWNKARADLLAIIEEDLIEILPAASN